MPTMSFFGLAHYLTIDRTTVTLGRGIRRLVSLYESLDDLLQAADDHNSNENEADADAEPPTTEGLEKKQEFVNILFFRLVLLKKV